MPCTPSRAPPSQRRGLRQSRPDAEWAAVRPLLPVPAWLPGRGGQPEAYCHRAILDAIRSLVDNGIKWRAMPVDFPPFLWNQLCQAAVLIRCLRSSAASPPLGQQHLPLGVGQRGLGSR
nr:transposase [Streptomyces sp.]